MAEFVRDHALQLVGIVGHRQQAAVDIDDLPTGDEGVDLGIVDQHDLDVGGVEPGGLDQRPRHVAEQQFGLAVAKHRLRGDGLGGGEGQRQREHHQTDQGVGDQREERPVMRRCPTGVPEPFMKMKAAIAAPDRVRAAMAIDSSA